jgi:HK97 family phage major capsid protein
MPRNIPPELEDKFRSCKEQVMADGESEEAAYGICYVSVVEGKSIEDATKFYYDGLKVGARNNRNDKQRIRDIRKAAQQIHDTTVEMEPDDEDKEPTALDEIEIIPVRAVGDEPLVFYGDAVKALGDGKLGGYLVRFSTDADPDLTGEYFTKDTDFGDVSSAAVYYNHGLDPVMKRRKLGKAELRQDEFGVWAETQLQMRDEYEKFIYEMAENGKMGWSSGTASHLVEKEQAGRAVLLKSWPLGLDASLTPTPAEPRNGVLPLKSIQVEPLIVSDNPIDAPASEGAMQDGAEQTEAGDDAKTFRKPVEDLTMEITEERLQELLGNAVKDGVEQAMKALPAVQTDVNVVTDEADQPFPTAGEFFQAVKNAAVYPSSQDVRLKSLKAQGLSEGVPADGGYLLAPQIAAGIQEKMYSTGQVLSRVAVDNIGANSNSMIYNAVDESDRSDGARFGGVTGYWMAEAGSKTASKPLFRQMELKLKKVAALCYATDELLADAVALESWLSRTVPLELKFKVEAAIMNGDGVGKPLGILQAPCLVTPLRIDASEVDGTDLAVMWSRRWAGLNDYVWFINPGVFPQLVNIVIGNFPALVPMSSGLSQAFSYTIFGKPVIETEYNPALGTAGDILLASMSQYQTIQKGGIQTASSIHVSFATDETAFRFVYRIDGQPLWSNALATYAATTTTQSPFVALAAATA